MKSQYYSLLRIEPAHWLDAVDCRKMGGRQETKFTPVAELEMRHVGLFEGLVVLARHDDKNYSGKSINSDDLERCFHTVINSDSLHAPNLSLTLITMVSAAFTSIRRSPWLLSRPTSELIGA